MNKTYEIEINYYNDLEGARKWCAELHLIENRYGVNDINLKTRLSVHTASSKEEAYRHAVIEMNNHRNKKKEDTVFDKKKFIVQTFYPFAEVNAYGPVTGIDNAELLKNKLEDQARVKRLGHGYSAQIIELESPDIPSITV